MGVVDALIRHLPARPTETQRVATALREEPAAGWAALARLAESLDDRLPDPRTRREALEVLHPQWLAALEPVIEALRNRPIPHDAEELASFHRVALALRAVREAWRRLGTDPPTADSEVPAVAEPDPAQRALARALDAQSRLLVLACRVRVALPREDWDQLCRLAHPLWEAQTLDLAPPFVEGTEQTPATPRAGLTLPLMLRLLEPLGLSGAGFDVACTIARQTAAKVGVRIDADGLPHVGANGPALVLSNPYTVRLDTRGVMGIIERGRARLAQRASPASIGLKTWLAPAAVDEVLAQLQTVWAPRHVPRPLARPPLPWAALRVGWPAVQTESDRLGLLSEAERVRASRETRPVRLDMNRFDDRMGGFGFASVASITPPAEVKIETPDEDRDAAVRALMGAEGETVEWRGIDARRAVFSRATAQPRLRLGDLVAVLPLKDASTAARRRASIESGEPPRLRMGRVVTLAQTGAADGRVPAAHDLGVILWPGMAIPVSIQVNRADPSESAWWLLGRGSEEPPSLLIPANRFEEPLDIILTEPAGQRRMRLTRLIERGPAHDRVLLASFD